MYSTFVKGEPKPQPRPRARTVKKGARVFPVIYSPVNPWRRKVNAALVEEAAVHEEWPLSGPVEVRLFFRMKRPKSAPNRPHPTIQRVGDVDNLAKAVLDAMNGVVFEDDAQVCDLRVTKAYNEREGVTIWVAPY